MTTVVTIEMLKALGENDGMTLKGYMPIQYKTGWQVATEGVECYNAEDAMKAIHQYDGNCGIWLEKGVYYIDLSHRVSTKAEAMRIGRECNQISILCWRNMKLAYCKEGGQA